MSHLRLAFALAMSVAIAPLALDAYLPAFPAMAASLGVDVHAVSLSVSVYIGALSVGQLFGGPLADRFGRRSIMAIGLALFSLTSFLISQTDSLLHLLVLRALQAFGGGWAVVCVPALVRDRAHGAEAAKLFSLIGLIMVAAPALAPALGGLLMSLGGWRIIFIFLTIYAVLVMWVLQRTVFAPGQQPARDKETPSGAEPNFLQRYLSVLATVSALRFIALQALVFSVMMLFITHASFIYQEHFGVSTAGFAALFGANVAAMALMMGANRVLLHRFAPIVILRGAVALHALGVLGLVLTTQFAPKLVLFAPALMVTVGAIGAITPNSQACYMEYFAKNGGTAAALMGALQFGVAGLISAASTALPESIQSVAASQAGCALLAVILIWWRARAVPAATKAPAQRS